MENIKKQRDSSTRSESPTSTPQKHEVNLKQNSALYFQIGLLLCLLVTYGLFEMKFKDKAHVLVQLNYDGIDVEYAPEPFTPEEKVVNQIKDSNPLRALLTKDPIIVEDDSTEPILAILTDPDPVFKPIDANAIIVVDKPVEPIEIFDISRVEQVPIYPGCESAKNNEERRACMSDKLSSLIQNKFDTSIANEYGLSGRQKIYVQFKIDQTGKVSEVLSRAPSKQLEKEAERVLKTVPQMVPGKQRYVPVSVIYSLPIVFDVQ